MKILADLAPVAAFFVAYQIGGMHNAIITLLIAAPAALVLLVATGNRPTRLQMATAALVVGLCAISLAMRDTAFILAKPTIVYWLMALAVLVAMRLGKNPARLVLAAAFAEANFGEDVWRRVALQWAAALLALGALNWLLAVQLAEEDWVVARTFGYPAITLVCLTVQITLLWRRTRQPLRQ